MQKRLREIAEKAWCTAAAWDDFNWDDEEPQQPNQAPATAAPTAAPAAPAPAPTPAPVQPSVPAAPMGRIAPPRPAVETPYAPPAAPSSRFDLNNAADRQAAVQLWVQQNYDSPNPLPTEWGSVNGILQDIAKAVTLIENDRKAPPKNPSLIQVKQHAGNVSVGDFEEKKRFDLAKVPMTPEQEQQRARWSKDAQAFSKSFMEKHFPFVKELMNRAKASAFSHGETDNDAGQNFIKETFFPRDNINAPDLRLFMLTKPAARQDLMAYQPFAQRFDEWLAKNGLTADQLNGWKKTTQTPDGKSFMVNTMSELLESNPPGAANSLIDAMTAVTQNEVPAGLKNHLAQQAHSYGLRRQDGRAGSYNAENDEGSSQAGNISTNNKVRSTAVMTPEVEATLDLVRTKFAPQMEKIVQLNNKVTDAFYEQANKYGEVRNGFQVLTVGGKTDKSQGKQYSLPDLWQMYSHLVKEQFNHLLNPQSMTPQDIEAITKGINAVNGKVDRGQIGMQDTLEQQIGGRNKRGKIKIKTDPRLQPRQQTEQGYADLDLNDPADIVEMKERKAREGARGTQEEGLNSLGIDINRLVSSQAISPYLYQLGVIKRRIYDYFEHGHRDHEKIAAGVQNELQSGQIHSLIRQEYSKNPKKFTENPERSAAFTVSPAMVKAALREALELDPIQTKAKGRPVYVYDGNRADEVVTNLKLPITPDGKHLASAIRNGMTSHWGKINPMLQQVRAENPDLSDEQTTGMWRSAIGEHTAMKEPIKQDEWDMVAKIPPAFWNGKPRTVEGVGSFYYPATNDIPREAQKEMTVGFKSEDPITSQPIKAEGRFTYENRVMKQIRDQLVQQGLKGDQLTQAMQQEFAARTPEIDAKYPRSAQIPPELREQYRKRVALEKKLRGRESIQDTRLNYEAVGQTPPQHINDWLDFLQEARGGKKTSRESRYHIAMAARRMLMAYVRQLHKLQKLADTRDTLRKVGSTPRLDSLVTSEARLAQSMLYDILPYLFG